MYSSNLPPAKTPSNFGPNFLSDKMAKMTFSVTIPVINDSGVSESTGVDRVFPKILKRTCLGSRSIGLMFSGKPMKKIKFVNPSLKNFVKSVSEKLKICILNFNVHS